MRASKAEQIASAGIGKVAAAFSLINWGVAENARHDLGTDLYLQARDERLFEPGLVVGAQVKTGESAKAQKGYFRRPLKGEDDEVRGWWFIDQDGKHLEAWAAHGLPHLLVLHDLDTGRSYWAHVTADKIVSTGKGAKIAVRIEHTVDEGHLGELLAVASTLRAGVAWEGSAWADPTHLVRSALLRHSLIVPRLIAPHPNAGQAVALTPEQAVALLAQARIEDYDRFAASQPDIPALDKAHESPNWPWRFVGALGRWLIDDDVDLLLSVAEDAPDPTTRAASTAAAASALLAETAPTRQPCSLRLPSMSATSGQ